MHCPRTTVVPIINLCVDSSQRVKLEPTGEVQYEAQLIHAHTIIHTRHKQRASLISTHSFVAVSAGGSSIQLSSVAAPRAHIYFHSTHNSPKQKASQLSRKALKKKKKKETRKSATQLSRPSRLRCQQPSSLLYNSESNDNSGES